METVTYINLSTYLGISSSITNKVLDYVSTVINEKPRISIEDMQKFTQSQYKKKTKHVDVLPIHITEDFSNENPFPKKKDMTSIGYDKIPLITKKDLYITSCIAILGICDVRWGDLYSHTKIHNFQVRGISEITVQVLDNTSPHLSKEDVIKIVEAVRFADDIFKHTKYLQKETYNDISIPFLIALLIIKQSHRPPYAIESQYMKSIFDEAINFAYKNSLFLYISLNNSHATNERGIQYTPRLPTRKVPKFAFATRFNVNIDISDDDIIEEIHISSSDDDEISYCEIIEESDMSPRSYTQEEYNTVPYPSSSSFDRDTTHRPIDNSQKEDKKIGNHAASRDTKIISIDDLCIEELDPDCE